MADWESDVSNLVFLPSEEHLESEDICRCLKERYKKDNIYTYINDIVVAVNPFKPIGLYSAKDVESYRGRRLHEKAPHLFGLADLAYREVLRSGKDACIVLTGESWGLVCC